MLPGRKKKNYKLPRSQNGGVPRFTVLPESLEVAGRDGQRGETGRASLSCRRERLLPTDRVTSRPSGDAAQERATRAAPPRRETRPGPAPRRRCGRACYQRPHCPRRGVFTSRIPPGHRRFFINDAADVFFQRKRKCSQFLLDFCGTPQGTHSLIYVRIHCEKLCLI